MTLLPDDLEVARRVADARVAVLEATRHVRSPRRSSRYRTTRNLIIAGAAVAVLTAGTIVVVQATQQTIDSTVYCYGQVGLEPEPIPGQGVGPGGGPIDPIEACTLPWAYDWFTDPQSEDDSHPVPELVACTLPDGTAAVFPREDGPPDDTDFCAALGLADWDSD